MMTLFHANIYFFYPSLEFTPDLQLSQLIGF
jgi:hypothetical protein